MGDFGTLIGSKLPFSPDNDNKPLHWVDLTDFKMTKNRITWGEFNLWRSMTNKDTNKYYKKISNRKVESKYDERMLKYIGDDYPAVANWKDAFDFCHWVGDVTGKKSPYLLRHNGNMLHVVVVNLDNLLTVIMSMT